MVSVPYQNSVRGYTDTPSDMPAPQGTHGHAVDTSVNRDGNGG
ncbi:MAG: hypothetical protein R3B96_03195 [Pirellulaceae bacterium]